MDKETIEKAKKEWARIQELGLEDILYKPYCLIIDYTPCVYRFYDEMDNIIYVGRTHRLDMRMSDHKSNTYYWNEVKKITFAKLKTKTDMAIYEIYYINKFKPKYNSQDKFDDCCSFELQELEFEEYDLSII